MARRLREPGTFDFDVGTDPKAYWLLLYDYVEDYVERRAPFRQAHLDLAQQAYDRGELVLAGALADRPFGAVLVFAAADASVAEDFARADPYVNEGVVTSWRVRPWNVVVGG
jgi:uncharacterized protein YciI